MQLGQILLRKHLISPQQLAQTIDIQGQRKEKIGQLFLKKGILKPEQLERALNEQYWRNNGFWVID